MYNSIFPGNQSREPTVPLDEPFLLYVWNGISLDKSLLLENNIYI